MSRHKWIDPKKVFTKCERCGCVRDRRLFNLTRYTVSETVEGGVKTNRTYYAPPCINTPPRKSKKSEQ